MLVQINTLKVEEKSWKVVVERCTNVSGSQFRRTWCRKINGFFKLTVQKVCHFIHII
jgi:hypothetical protein